MDLNNEKIVDKFTDNLTKNKSEEEASSMLDYLEFISCLVDLSNRKEFVSSDMFDYAEENDTKYSEEAFTRMFFELNSKLNKYSHDNFIAIYNKYIEDYDLDNIIFVKFKDIIYRFESTHGQGSYVLFQKNLEQDIPKESYINFEDFMEGTRHECYEYNKESYLVDNLEYIYEEFQKDGISKEDFKSALIKFINKLN